MPYYIAYGSNMWKAQMYRRCPAAAGVRKIALPNRRLIFRTYADLEHAPGEIVHCALYKVTRACLERLDWFEGVNSGAYFRHSIRLQTPDLGIINAVTYLNGRPGFAPPTAEYVSRLKQGYRDWQINPKHLDRVLKRAGVPVAKKVAASGTNIVKMTGPATTSTAVVQGPPMPVYGRGHSYANPLHGYGYGYGDNWPYDSEDWPEGTQGEALGPEGDGSEEDAGGFNPDLWRNYRHGR